MKPILCLTAIVSSTLLVGCSSKTKTETLQQNFTTEAKAFETALQNAINSDQQARLAPLAQKFGEKNCQTIKVEVSKKPFGLRQEPNDLTAPYNAQVHISFTVLPIGHRLPEGKTGWRASADEKLHWRFRSIDDIVAWITNDIKDDAEFRKEIRTNPSEP